METFVDLLWIHMGCDAVYHLIPQHNSDQDLPAGALKFLAEDKGSRNNHRAGMATGILMPVIQLHCVGEGSVDHGCVGRGVDGVSTQNRTMARAQGCDCLAEGLGIFPVAAARDGSAYGIHNALFGLYNLVLRQILLVGRGNKRSKMFRQIHILSLF